MLGRACRRSRLLVEVGRCGGLVVMVLAGLLYSRSERKMVNSSREACSCVVLVEVVLKLVMMVALLVLLLDERTSFEV